MGTNQKNLSVPKETWTNLEKMLQENGDILEMWNIITVPDLFKACLRLGMKNLLQNVAEFRTVHKPTKENPQKQ